MKKIYAVGYDYNNGMDYEMFEKYNDIVEYHTSKEKAVARLNSIDLINEIIDNVSGMARSEYDDFRKSDTHYIHYDMNYVSYVIYDGYGKEFVIIFVEEVDLIED